jgi:hypothetical protein
MPSLLPMPQAQKEEDCALSRAWSRNFGSGNNVRFVGTSGRSPNDPHCAIPMRRWRGSVNQLNPYKPQLFNLLFFG